MDSLNRPPQTPSPLGVWERTVVMVAKRIQRRLEAILAVDVVDYRVTETEVIDARHARLAPDDGRPALTLMTCYPFDALRPGGSLRYVVTAAEAWRR